MSKQLEIEIVGDVPESINPASLTRVVSVLNDRRETLGLPGGTVNLVLIDDEAMRDLNRSYSGNDYTTDVLSFNYLESGEAIDGVIGEMAISYPTAGCQATAAGISLSDEVAVLGMHGLLHIGGYDHQDVASRAQMQAIQHEIADAAEVTYREFAWQD